jgi:ketosteroid isomerase-like protein
VSLSANAQLLIAKTVEFNAGNTAIMYELWAENGVWHAAGDNASSGDFRGREACGRWFVETAEILGRPTVDVQDVLCDDEYVVFFNRVVATREGAVLDQVHMNAWRFQDGLAVEGWFLPADVAAWDAFVGARGGSSGPGRRGPLVSRPRTAG